MVKKRISLLVEKGILKQWDDLASKIGTDRTSMIHNAVKVYDLFINNQLNGNKDEDIKDQLGQIIALIEGLKLKRKVVNTELDSEEYFKSLNREDIPDFDIIAEKVLKLLDGWGALPDSTIATHLQYPTWIIWTVLKKLKSMKKVKVERGEWTLYA